MRFQVTLDNGRGQGAYGTGNTVAEAARNAAAQWRVVEPGRKPSGLALTYAPSADRGGLGGIDARTEYLPPAILPMLVKGTVEEPVAGSK